MSIRSVLIGLVLLSVFTAPLSAAAVVEAIPDGELIRGALVSAGIRDVVDLTLEQRAVEQEIHRIRARLGAGRPTYHQARRLHRLLHRLYLRTYRHDADHLGDILARGEYNCVSATLFYGLAARSLGYDVQILEYPGHLMLRLHVGSRPVDIETTSRHGFDDDRFLATHAPAVLATTSAPLRSRQTYRALSLRSAVGYVWLNQAWRDLKAGDALGAARRGVEAASYLPAPEDDQAGGRRLLARAFQTEYGRGDFEQAYRIAALDLATFSSTTTSVDRLLAAALKRVLDACDEDDPARADAIIEDVTRLVSDSREADRLVWRVAPTIAASAVRNELWALAVHSAERYASVERDNVEAERVLEWVHSRREAARHDAGPPDAPRAGAAVDQDARSPGPGPVTGSSIQH